jgi:hypothetical protein
MRNHEIAVACGSDTYTTHGDRRVDIVDLPVDLKRNHVSHAASEELLIHT